MEEALDDRAPIDEYVAHLKTLIPAAEHSAVDSRVEELVNDSSADVDDILSILHQEFDPEP